MEERKVAGGDKDEKAKERLVMHHPMRSSRTISQKRKSTSMRKRTDKEKGEWMDWGFVERIRGRNKLDRGERAVFTHRAVRATSVHASV
jgi:hypothetical protein